MIPTDTPPPELRQFTLRRDLYELHAAKIDGHWWRVVLGHVRGQIIPVERDDFEVPADTLAALVAGAEALAGAPLAPSDMSGLLRRWSNRQEERRLPDRSEAAFNPPGSAPDPSSRLPDATPLPYLHEMELRCGPYLLRSTTQPGRQKRRWRRRKPADGGGAGSRDEFEVRADIRAALLALCETLHAAARPADAAGPRQEAAG